MLELLRDYERGVEGLKLQELRNRYRRWDIDIDRIMTE